MGGPRGILSRTRGASGVVVGGALLLGFALVFALAPSIADAAPNPYTVRFQPSPSSNVAGYRLEIRQMSSGNVIPMDIGTSFSGPSGGVASFDITLEDSTDNLLVLYAYNSSSVDSAPSNLITVQAANPPAQCGNDSDCSDSDVCTGSERCVGGACQAGTPLVCTAPGQCQLGSCDAQQGCVVNNISNGTSCNDGNSGTINDACQAGVCVGQNPPQCGNDSDCSDGDLCSGTERCVGGSCQPGTPLVCSAPGQCQIGSCNVAAGCVVSNRPNGTACNDGNSSTINDACSAGVCAGTGDPMAGAFDLTVSSDGIVYGVDLAGSSQSLLDHPMGNNTDQRPAWCDVDGDGDFDLVAGFGPGSNSQILISYWANGGLTSNEIVQAGWPAYDGQNGETFPACGDVDGDGRDELLVGLGAEAQGWLQVLDDKLRGFAPYAGAPAGNGFVDLGVSRALLPAAGDVDGDGRDEIIVGYENTGTGVTILDDALTGFDPFDDGRADSKGSVSLTSWNQYVSSSATTRPASGDVDGDGLDEIVIAFGPGGNSHVLVMDDADHAFAVYKWITTTLSGSYNAQNGETVAAVGDVDNDGKAEIAIGFGAGTSGSVQVRDDADAGFTPHPGTTGANGFLALGLSTANGPLRPGVQQPGELTVQASASDCPAASRVSLGGKLGDRLRSCLCAREIAAEPGGDATGERLFSATACGIGALATDLIGD